MHAKWSIYSSQEMLDPDVRRVFRKSIEDFVSASQIDSTEERAIGHNHDTFVFQGYSEESRIFNKRFRSS